MHPYPHYSKRVWQSLDSIWDFRFLGEEATLDGLDLGGVNYDDQLCVPGVFDVTPKYAGRRGLALYRRNVDASAGRLKLRFGGIGLWARVFWDGKAVGTLDLPYSGMEFEFRCDRGGEHTLVVAIDNRFDFKRTPLFSQYYDFYAYGGFYRGVELHELPACSLERVRVATRDLSKGIVDLDIELSGAVPVRLDFTVAFDRQAPARHSGEVRDGHVRLSLPVPDFRPWSPESPQLHTVTVALADDAITERFGIRTVSVDGDRICVNGAPHKLLGYCRHEAHPEFGAGAIRGWRDRFKAHWSEEFQAEMLGTICRYVMERPRVAGIALWHFADAQTYTSAHALMRPRTINDKGTLDEYRRPKLAYDQVQRAFRGRFRVCGGIIC